MLTLLFIPAQVQQMPLHLAALHGNTELVRLFIEKGAEIDSADKVCCVFFDKLFCSFCFQDDNTAMHFACEGGFADIVEALLTANAVVSRNKAGLTPVQVASAKGHHNVLAVFDRFPNSLPTNALTTTSE